MAKSKSDFIKPEKEMFIVCDAWTFFLCYGVLQMAVKANEGC